MDMENNLETSLASILVVDDDPGDLATLGMLLEPYFEVLAAPSGERGLQIAAGAGKPDLILLDVLMPDMNGYTVLAKLRDNITTRDIPVIFITGQNSIEDEERGLELGAVDYITKPYSPPVILARLHTQLELKAARDRLKNQNAYLEAELARRLKENQKVQMQLLQSEKLAAIGLLTAGIVHEINTPVGFVKANLKYLDGCLRDFFRLFDAYEEFENIFAANATELAKIRDLKQRLEVSMLREDIGQLISESREGLARVEQIVADLKNFSRMDSMDWQKADLHKGIESTLNIVWNEIKYHCTLHKNYGDIPDIYCIPSQINQVFLNLLINAAQAIPKKGEITIHTGQSGDEIFIAIADTGSGIPAENLSRLFEPFFTTKPVGKGTGLGLSIAYSIVQKHKGRLEVDSIVGKGTTFTVWLPV